MSAGSEEQQYIPTRTTPWWYQQSFPFLLNTHAHEKTQNEKCLIPSRGQSDGGGWEMQPTAIGRNRAGAPGTDPGLPDLAAGGRPSAGSDWRWPDAEAAAAGQGTGRVARQMWRRRPGKAGAAATGPGAEATAAEQTRKIGARFEKMWARFGTRFEPTP
jgi:hypothetical protein